MGLYVRKRKRIRLLRGIFAAAGYLFVFVLVSFFLISCGKQGSRDTKIQIVVEEYPVEGENAAQIPSFVSKDEQIMTYETEGRCYLRQYQDVPGTR